MSDCSRKMEVETFIDFYRQWMKVIPDGIECEVIWHGGEPTLRGIDFYEQVLSASLGLTPNSKRVRHCLQTNGVLINKQWADLFRTYGVLVGVSIDGPKEFHDMSRVMRDGSGSFLKAINAYRLLKLSGASAGVVVVVNKHNVAFPDKIIQFMDENGIKKLQLSPCMEFGDKNDDYSVTVAEFSSFICRLYDLWLKRDDPGMSIGFISDVVDHLLGTGQYNCLLSDRCCQFAILDWTGELKTCDGMRTRQQVVIDGNNIAAAEFQEKWSAIHNRISQARLSECGLCEWYKICHGGCPYHWPDSGVQKTAFCAANKQIFTYIAGSIRSIYGGG